MKRDKRDKRQQMDRWTDRQSDRQTDRQPGQQDRQADSLGQKATQRGHRDKETKAHQARTKADRQTETVLRQSEIDTDTCQTLSDTETGHS